MAFSLHPTQIQTAVTEHNLALPEVVHPYGLLLAFFLSRSTASHTIVSTGWTDLGGSSVGGGSGIRRATLARITDGTEGGGVLRIDTGSARESCAQVLYFPIRQWAGLSLAESVVAGASVQGNPAANLDPPTVTPAWGAKPTQWMTVYGARNDGPGSPAVSGYPAGYSGGLVLTSTEGSNHIELGMAFREATTVAENPGPWATANLVSLCNTFGVRLYEPPTIGAPVPSLAVQGGAPTPGQAALGVYGELLEGDADIDQSIRTILGTQAGTVPFHSDFGVDWLSTIDRPIPVAAPIVVGMAQAALERYEPRIVVKRIEPVVETEPGALRLRVRWVRKSRVPGEERSTLAP